MTRPLAIYAAHDDDVTLGVAALEAAGFDVVQSRSDDPDVLAEFGRDAVALLVAYGTVDADLIARLPHLEVVSLISQGYDNVDVDACVRAGVQVAHLPPVATEEVATHAWALTLALVRGLPFYARATAETWTDRPRSVPRRLSELTIGVVGTGHTAAAYARLAAGHVRETVSWSRGGRTIDGVRPVADLHRMAAECDLISLHLPLGVDTEHVVDAPFLAAMRPGAYLVNVARGGLVDSRALARALDSGHLAGAALDVLDEEPPGPDHPLADRDDVLLTPHVAWFSEESERAYVMEQADNVIAWHRTGAVTHPVTPTP